MTNNIVQFFFQNHYYYKIEKVFWMDMHGMRCHKYNYSITGGIHDSRRLKRTCNRN